MLEWITRIIKHEVICAHASARNEERGGDACIGCRCRHPCCWPCLLRVRSGFPSWLHVLWLDTDIATRLAATVMRLT